MQAEQRAVLRALSFSYSLVPPSLEASALSIWMEGPKETRREGGREGAAAAEAAARRRGGVVGWAIGVGSWLKEDRTRMEQRRECDTRLPTRLTRHAGHAKPSEVRRGEGKETKWETARD